MGSNSPAFAGKKNLLPLFASLIKAGITKVELKTIDVWGTAEMLIEEGELTLSTAEGKLIDKGKYLVVWKKEGDKWKIFRDMSNSDGPAAGK
jgi:ketosteroid isomerase-like protein